MEKYGFIYLWYDRKRKMYYVGSHYGTEDDGYICSSNRMRDAYRRRPQDFKRRIIQKNIERRILLDEEYRWLSLIDNGELGKKYYNLKNHKWGHWTTDKNTRMTISEKISKRTKELHQDPEYRKRFLEGRKKLPAQTKEQIEKRALSNTGKKRSDETKKRISEANKGEKHHMYGKHLSDETKKKLKDRMTGENNPFYGKTHSKEKMKQIAIKISVSMKGRKPKNSEYMKTTFWWNNGLINTRQVQCPGEGWVKGKLKK